MGEKTYTLELTADEARVLCLHGVVPPGHGVSALEKVRALRDEVEADRKADELRLPWRVSIGSCGNPEFFMGEKFERWSMPERLPAMRLMSAAPELLELARMVERVGLGFVIEGRQSAAKTEVMRLCRRALRKVETGIPE